MSETDSTSNVLVLSYLSLRKAVGIIGVSLPFVLVIGKRLVEGPGIEPSISDYYYTIMGDVFVGSLCAVGVFLLSYRGYEKKDDLAGDFACLCSIGVALFPTRPELASTHLQTNIGRVHYALATLLFLTLAYFSLVLFRKTNPEKPMTQQKKQRNVIYKVCGIAMLACIGLLGLNALFPGGPSIQRLHPVFWLETIALLFFGISWLVKGEAILTDRDTEEES